jgi:hypothetical protein
MGKPRFRSIAWRAARRTGAIVLASSWQAWAVKVVTTLGVLAGLYAITQSTPPGDEALFANAWTTATVSVCVMLGLLLLVFLAQLTVVAPYQLWKEEWERAEVAEAALVLPTKIDRTARFHEAMAAFRHIAHAKELWWAENHRREGPSPLGTRPLELISEIRQFFPPEASGDYKTDQISRLWNAMVLYGGTLGYAQGETDRLKADREKFEREFQATIDRFESLSNE